MLCPVNLPPTPTAGDAVAFNPVTANSVSVSSSLVWYSDNIRVPGSWQSEKIIPPYDTMSPVRLARVSRKMLPMLNESTSSRKSIKAWAVMSCGAHLIISWSVDEGEGAPTGKTREGAI